MNPTELGRLVAGVLEEAAFVLSQVAPSPPPHEGEPLFVTSLPLENAPFSRVYLAGSEALARMLVEGLLGELPTSDVLAEHCEDALKELLNIVAGELSARLTAASGSPVMIGLPSVTQKPTHEWARELAQKSLAVTLVTEEGHRIDAAAS